MNLNQPDVPCDADPALVWAVNREFTLRWIRWRRYRLGLLGASFDGVTEAMRRFAVALTGKDAA